MTTVEGNKLIKDFMNHTEFNTLEDKLRYHTSWDSLMPVVEKIETILFTDFIIEGRWSQCRPLNNEVFRNRGENKIQSVWLTVTQFILWYNQNNK